MARAAELQNHEQDAMAFYEHALLERFEAQQMPETGMPDEMADNARRLFTKLGGTNDAWQIWYGSRADNLSQPRHAHLGRRQPAAALVRSFQISKARPGPRRH